MTDATRDREILAAIQAGNNNAIGELYDRYAPRLLPIALRILRNRRDAEDLIHDVFVEAWQNAASYDPVRGTVRNWLTLRLRSRAIDRLRVLKKAREYAMIAGGEAQSQATVSDNAAIGADCALARRALAVLSKAQREVIELGYFRGLSCSEISRRCGIPLGTVKSRLSGAINRLRQQLAISTEAL